MTDDASLEAAGDAAGGPPSAACSARPSIFDLRQVAPLTPDEQRAKEDAMERTLAFGAQPVRDGRGWPLEVDFIAANGEAVEPWRHDPRHKRLYRRSQDLAKAARQLIGQPGDRVEIAKRLALLHHREGSDIEGAVRRGLFDAIWRYDHVYDSFTVPRRYGSHFMKTGRVAAVAEEQRRKWQTEGLAPADAFWVRNRRNTGLVLVSPNPDPDAEAPTEFPGEALGGEGAETVVGQADIDTGFESFLPADDFDVPTEAYDPTGFYRLEEGEDGAFFIFDPEGAREAAEGRRQLSERTLDDVFEGFVAVLDAGADADDPLVQQIGRLVFELAPGSGHVLSAREAYKAFSVAATAMQDGDWEAALLNGGQGLLDAVGAIPGLGDLLRIGKGAVKIANLLLKLGRAAGAKMTVLSMAQKGGGRGKGAGVPGSTKGEGSKQAESPTAGVGGRGNESPEGDVRPPPRGDLLEPVGEGVFGPIFTATGPFSGKAGWQKAIETLSHYKTGEVPAALHHKDVGFISVVWGLPGTSSHDGYGLSKILRFHSEVSDDLPDLIRSMSVVSKSKNRIQLESSTHRAGIRLDWDQTRKKWLLTAFRKDGAASR